MNIISISNFEKVNSMKINVFEINKNKDLTPTHVSHYDPIGYNLILYKNHYILCKNMNSFSENSHGILCLNCLNSYYAINDKHMKMCIENKLVKARFHKDEYYEFHVNSIMNKFIPLL